MDNTKPISIDPKDVEYEVAPELKQGVYSNGAQLTASQDDITINFLYLNPNDKPQGTLVSRVIMTRERMKSLAEALQNAEKQITEAEKNMKGEK